MPASKPSWPASSTWRTDTNVDDADNLIACTFVDFRDPAER